MSAEELEALLATWKQPRFRAKQVRSWIYDRGEPDFERMSNLPAKLRAQLQEHATVGPRPRLRMQEGVRRLGFAVKNLKLLHT